MSKLRHYIDSFIRDKHGRLTLWQTPNPPLILWIIFTIISFFVSRSLNEAAHQFGTIFLSIWAYLEITTGSSPFRRTLGALVATVIFYGIITRQ